MGKVACFFLEPTKQVEFTLRRYHSSADPATKCPGPYGYHNAAAAIGKGNPIFADLSDSTGCGNDEHPHDDPRWPAKCDYCDYRFEAKDAWQYNEHVLYKRSDNGELVTLQTAPAGAMWDAYWMGDTYRGFDGKCLVVRTPGGDWTVDGPAANNSQPKGWKRTGSVPKVTAHPSIHIPGRYHGWLRDGVLEEC